MLADPSLLEPELVGEDNLLDVLAPRGGDIGAGTLLVTEQTELNDRSPIAMAGTACRALEAGASPIHADKVTPARSRQQAVGTWL